LWEYLRLEFFSIQPVNTIIGNDFMSYKDPSTIVSELQKLSEKQKIGKQMRRKRGKLVARLQRVWKVEKKVSIP
jgi:hypothetical protein